MAVAVVENPGTVERQTTNGMAPVCNAIVQTGTTRVRCAFWRDMADKLAAAVSLSSCVLLYQVLVTKKQKDADSRELLSWRGTTILPCPEAMADQLLLGRMARMSGLRALAGLRP